MNPAFTRFYGENRRLLIALSAVLVIDVLFVLLALPPIDTWVEQAEAAMRASEKRVAESETEYGRARLEAMLLESAQDRIAALNRDTLKSTAARYPTVDLKIKSLAEGFGLSPKSYNYDYALLDMEQLQRLSVTFRLKGSYDDLRQFVAQIEQARDDEGNDLFFAIEQVSLQDSTEKGAELNLNLSVTTYFHEPELTAESGRRGPTRRTRRQR